MKFKWKQTFAVFAVTSAMTFAYASAAPVGTTETIPVWASEEITSWKDMGLLKGNQEGRILPNDQIRKTEFLAFVNRVFNFSEESELTFEDVPPAAWYAPEIKKAVAAGAIIGSGGGKIDPLEILTREKAALILSRVFNVAASENNGIPFSDDNAIADWAKDAIYAMKEAGYVEGTPSGAFLPKSALTRAEAVKMINNAMGTLIANENDHSNISGTNLIVNTSGGTLSDLNLSGSLYITPGVGEGNLSLVNAKIGGVVYINGGGIHSITMANSTVKKIVINKPSGPVRVLLSGTTTVETIDVLTGSQIVNEAENTIGSVNLLTGKEEAVSLSGNAEQLNMNKNTIFTLESGQITKLNISEKTDGSRIQLSKGTVVKLFTFNSAATVIGEGVILEAVINADGVSLAKKPDKLTLNVKKVKLGGQEFDEFGMVTTPVTSSGGSTVTQPVPEVPVPEVPVPPKDTVLYSYAEALSTFKSIGTEGTVKQYLTFLQDPTYMPSTANPDVVMPDFANANIFVNYQFTIKPSLFASLRGVNSSVLDNTRTYLWIGTDSGVTRINLKTNEMKSYVAEDKQLYDDKVILLISDGSTGVFTITEAGVSHIYQ